MKRVLVVLALFILLLALYASAHHQVSQAPELEQWERVEPTSHVDEVNGCTATYPKYHCA